MRPRAWAALALGVVCILAPAVGWCQPVLADRQDGGKLRVASGAILTVRLTSNPSTGYTWRMIGGAPTLRLVSQRYDAPPSSRAPIGMVGRPGLQSFRVKVMAPPGRRAALKFAYRRWWTRVGLARVWTVNVQTVGRGR